MHEHVLEGDGIQLEFDQRRILSDIYIKAETGKITGLLGRNGQGKSCLMNIIYGSLPAASKSIRFDGGSVFQAFKRPDLVLYLPQFHFIPKRLTVHRVFTDFQVAFEPFEKLFSGFGSLYNLSVGKLSGGQRRLLEVYIIVRSPTQFVLLDEPFSHIMPVHIEKIKEVLAEERLGKGILITDHMYQHITGICDHLYILKEGKTHLTKSITDIEKLGYARL